ncbi:MAG: methionine--tRNA ligase [Candidatus Andersenbacteria bacterium]
MAKFYITTPIYYVNSAPHIGSAYTTIAADVLARYHRKKGDDTFLLTGTAEHGTKIAFSAEKAGKSPQEFTNENAQKFKLAWEKLDISYDDFIRTTEARHEAAVILFFEKLKESGQIYEGEYEGLYCVGHEAFVKEADLTEDGLCPDHNTAPEKVKEQNWFFKLSDYGQVLKERIESGELQVEPESRRNEVLSFINQGLEDIAISRRNVPWAIPLPWDKDQTIYVWLDELFNYCSAIGYGQDQEKFHKYWPADVHVVGKDIIKFHCIIWPALLLAINEELPRKVFAHGFFTVDGQKISKSLGNAIDPVQLVEEYGSDAVRYFVLRDIPFGSDGDFSHERFKNRYNADLANGLGNLTSRALNMIEKFTPGLEQGSPLPAELAEKLTYIDGYIEALAFDKALTEIWEVIAWADQLIETTKPWELAKAGQQDKIQDILAQLLTALETVNEKTAPFMPKTHATLSRLLEDRPLKKPLEPLFARK